MAKPQTGSAALAKAEPTGITLDEQQAALAAFLGDEGEGLDSGLSELDASDIKLPALVWNMKGTVKLADGSEESIPFNTIFDTVNETQRKSVDLIFLQLHKSNAFVKFSDATQKNEPVCRSNDRKIGTVQATGETRKCEGCPHAQWQNVEGKRKRDCSEVWNTLAVDVEHQQPVFIRFKKTALPAIKDHVNKHHAKKLVMGGKRLDVPFFAYRVKMSLEIQGTQTKYAVPVLTRGDQLTTDELRRYAQESATAREYLTSNADKVEDQVSSVEAPDDTSGGFGNDANAFRGNGDADFIDAPAA